MTTTITEADALDRIVWGMGLTTIPDIRAGLDRLPGLTKVKYGRVLWDSLGPEFLRELVAAGYDVFDDAKLTEIPTELWKLTKIHAGNQPWMLNCMMGSRSSGKLSGKEMDGLKGFAEICGEHDVLSCGVSVLTSKQPADVLDEFNQRTALEQVLNYAEVAVAMGVRFLVCSPQEAEALRRRYKVEELGLICPGIKMPGAPANPDQPRSFEPGEALDAQVDYLVINRAITNGDVAGNLKAIVGDMVRAA